MKSNKVAYIDVPTHDTKPLCDGYKSEPVVTIDDFIDKVNQARSEGKRIIIQGVRRNNDSIEIESETCRNVKTKANQRGRKRLGKTIKKNERGVTHKTMCDKSVGTSDSGHSSSGGVLPAKFRRKSAKLLGQTETKNGRAKNITSDSPNNKSLLSDANQGAPKKRERSLDAEDCNNEPKRMCLRPRVKKPSYRV